MKEIVTVHCPCCETRLRVDVATEAIVSEERPKKKTDQTFDEAVQNVRAGAGRRQEAFDRAFQQQKNRDDLLDKKFAEAKEKAKKDKDERRINPLDFD
ncbi:MAG: hypothetical protein OES25_00505 [Acidobacteriota bacterium]|nr:hypothetical protein [Acidobacteriota bacterium]